jgi:predicted DNA-binding transcriptional regulator AlpA
MSDVLLHDIKSAVRVTSMSRSHLYRAMDAGALDKVKVGKRVYFTPEMLKAYVDKVVANSD